MVMNAYKMKVKKKNNGKVSREVIELVDNPVREYLSSNTNKKLSINSLHKILSVKKRTVLHYCQNSKYIRTVSPWEVGSNKHSLNVYTYIT